MLAACLAGQALWCLALATAAGLGRVGWAGLLVCLAVLDGVLALALARSPWRAPGPADLVTFARAVLACLVAALVTEALVAHRPTPGTVVPVAVVALVLDSVDGRVARLTGTSSAFGARFDGEADAFLILVLSVVVARTAGGWVLAAGLVRYVFAMAGWVLPWMRARLPFRYWRKVVTAALGTVLVAAASGLLPPGLSLAVLLVGMVLLAESFGRDVWWLWAHRVRVPVRAGEPVPVRAAAPAIVREGRA